MATMEAFLESPFQSIERDQGLPAVQVHYKRAGLRLYQMVAGWAKVTLCTAIIVPHERPCIVRAAGLTPDRVRYLVTHVRPYLREANKDIACPLESAEE